MARNDTEIRRAIKFMLKRYDLISAWKQMLPHWAVDLFFGIIYTFCVIWFLLSIATFTPSHLYFHTLFLVLFSWHPLFVFTTLLLIVIFIRALFDKQTPISVYPLTAMVIQSNKRKNDPSARFSSMKPKFGKELIILGVIFLVLVYTVGYYSLIVIVPVIVLMILPAFFKTFYFSIFLPRIIITVSYVWVTFIFTEENTRFMRSLPDSAYIIAFIIGSLGSVAFLWFEAQQNAPSVRKSELLLRRVLPVFSYSIFFSIFIGLIFEVTSSVKRTQATSDESYYFRNNASTLSTTISKLEGIQDFKLRIERDWENLPDIRVEVGFQRLGETYNYSRNYKANLRYLKSQIENYNQALEYFCKNNRETDMILNNFTRTKICIEAKLPLFIFDTSKIKDIVFVKTAQKDSLLTQVNQFYRNDSIFRNTFNEHDSILYALKRDLTISYDTLSDPEKSKSIVQAHSGYKIMETGKSKDPIFTVVDSLQKIQNNNAANNPDINAFQKKVFCSQYPVFIWKDYNIAADFNLKRFLIQVIVAVAIGVVGQLILADKTVTEPV